MGNPLKWGTEADVMQVIHEGTRRIQLFLRVSLCVWYDEKYVIKLVLTNLSKWQSAVKFVSVSSQKNSTRRLAPALSRLSEPGHNHEPPSG